MALPPAGDEISGPGQCVLALHLRSMCLDGLQHSTQYPLALVQKFSPKLSNPIYAPDQSIQRGQTLPSAAIPKWQYVRACCKEVCRLCWAAQAQLHVPVAHHFMNGNVLRGELLRRCKNSSHERRTHSPSGIQNHACTWRPIVQHNACVLSALLELLCASFRCLQFPPIWLACKVKNMLLCAFSSSVDLWSGDRITETQQIRNSDIQATCMPDARCWLWCIHNLA